MKAGISHNKAKKRGYIICKRPEVFAELVRLGAIVPDGEIGDAAKAVLVHKLNDHQRITNREIAPFLQMSLQTSKKIGAGSVQQVPQTQTNIQININPIERELMRQVMEQIQQENPGKQILIQGVNDEKVIKVSSQNRQSNGGMEAGQAPLQLEARSDSEIEISGIGGGPFRSEEG